MAHHANQPSSRLLWLIGPAAVGITLLFTNLHITEPLPQMPGDLGLEKVKNEMPAHNEHATPPADEHATEAATSGHADEHTAPAEVHTDEHKH
ncbi:MAG: hypothetical protein ACKVOR_06835 [Flavobacteriales bacterium]